MEKISNSNKNLNLYVKHEIFDFENEAIRYISLQHHGEILAFSGGNHSDNLKLAKVKIDSNYSEENNSSKVEFTALNNSPIKKNILMLKWS